MTWLYQGTVINSLPEDCVGFVYLITNTTNNRKYIGKKFTIHNSFITQYLCTLTAGVRYMSKHSTESDVEFDARYESFFNRKDIDGWECRKVKHIIIFILILVKKANTCP